MPVTFFHPALKAGTLVFIVSDSKVLTSVPTSILTPQLPICLSRFFGFRFFWLGIQAN